MFIKDRDLVDSFKIISTAKDNACLAKEKGVVQVKLPVLSFPDWSLIFQRPDNLAAREEFRAWQKRNYYFKRFLGEEDIVVDMIVCRAEPVSNWAGQSGHPMTNDRERMHVLTHYVNRPNLPLTDCVHQRPLTVGMAASGLELFASLTTYGETAAQPEILSVAVHTREGWIVDSLEILAIYHTPQEAFGLAGDFLSRHGVKNAFHDSEVRRPRFCPDCNELLLNVAGSHDYEQLNQA